MAFAAARPIPLVPPVTSDTFPSNFAIPSPQPLLSSTCRLVQKGFHFLVEVARDRKGFGISVRSQETSHPVVRDVHSVRAFVDEYGDGSVGAGIRNVLGHFFHDERIADDEADDFGFVAA